MFLRPTIAILGAGQQGADLTLLCLRAGLPVVVEDVFPDKLRSLRVLAGREVGEAEAAGLLRFAATVEDAVRSAELILDSVPDELESKLEIFSLVDRMAPPRAVFCSPLREVEISDVAACTYRAEYCIGVRTGDGWAAASWLAAPDVVLTRGLQTSDGTVQAASGFWQSLGKAVTVMRDANAEQEQPSRLR